MKPTPPPPKRGNRVTDATGGNLDPAQHAIRMERLEGEQRLLAAQVKQSVDVLSNALVSLQADMREVSRRMPELGGLEETKRAVADINSRLEGWFDSIKQENQRRWEIYEANRDNWRRQHEAANLQDKRETEQEIRNVRETVIRYAAFAAGMAVLGGTVIGGFLWSINDRFRQGKEDIEENRQATVLHRRLIDEVNKELFDVRLYLSRGGRIPAEPYIDPNQRKENGHKAE